MAEPRWLLANEYGQGCKAYADANSLTVSGSIARAKIKHFLVPPGTDNRNQRPVQEVVFDKEFDFDRKLTRYHSITFIYTDGAVAEPLQTEPEWAAAEKGSLTELNFVHSLASPKKKSWWSPFQ